MTNTALELDPQVMRAVEVLYREAAVAFGSMQVNWWVTVAPSSFGPEVSLRAGWQGAKWRLVLSHRMILAESELVERMIRLRVREIRTRVTERVP